MASLDTPSTGFWSKLVPAGFSFASTMRVPITVRNRFQMTSTSPSLFTLSSGKSAKPDVSETGCVVPKLLPCGLVAASIRDEPETLRYQTAVTNPLSSTPMSGELEEESVAGGFTGLLLLPNPIVRVRAAVLMLRVPPALKSARDQTAVARPVGSTATLGLERETPEAAGPGVSTGPKLVAPATRYLASIALPRVQTTAISPLRPIATWKLKAPPPGSDSGCAPAGGE